MPLEAARLDPEGRGAARRGGCFNPPQYRPDTNLLGFRVLIWSPAGRVIREALDRAKTTSPERNASNSHLFLRRLELKRVARGGHVAWPTHGHAAEDSSGKGCSDLIASASCALQLERVESQKRSPRESCSCAGLSPKLHCARLGWSRVLKLRKPSSQALGHS